MGSPGGVDPLGGGRRAATGAGGAGALRRRAGDLEHRGAAAGGDLWTAPVEGGELLGGEVING